MCNVYVNFKVSPEMVGSVSWNSFVDSAGIISKEKYDAVEKTDMDEVWGGSSGESVGVCILPGADEESLAMVQSGEAAYSTKMVGFVGPEGGDPEEIVVELEEKEAAKVFDWVKQGKRVYVMHRL